MSRTQLDIGGLAVGDAIEPVSIRLSRQRLVMIAAANRDFAPIHFDREIARETGADDAYGNMMFVMAMMERALTQWAGLSARVRAIRSVRMKAFNRSGDRVTCCGRITVLDPESGTAELEMWLETGADRRTATAQAVLEFPTAG